MKLAFDDKAHAHASPDRHKGEGSDASAMAMVPLGESGGIDVVLDDGRAPE